MAVIVNGRIVESEHLALPLCVLYFACVTRHGGEFVSMANDDGRQPRDVNNPGVSSIPWDGVEWQPHDWEGEC